MQKFKNEGHQTAVYVDSILSRWEIIFKILQYKESLVVGCN